MTSLGTEFWTKSYIESKTGWDIGFPSPPLIEYCKQIPRETRILIPGGGNAHEWLALRDLGFENTHVLDLSPYPITQLKERFPDDEKLFMVGDFFSHEEHYDLVLEQTFFCALDPSLRTDYIQKMKEVISDGGALAGVLFRTEFERVGPPFGGNEDEYRSLFSEEFYLETMEPCRNSIPERMGNELFFIARPH